MGCALLPTPQPVSRTVSQTNGYSQPLIWGMICNKVKANWYAHHVTLGRICFLFCEMERTTQTMKDFCKRFAVISYRACYRLQPPRLLCSWDSLGKNTAVGCHALLQGTFLTQGSNPSLLCLLHWKVGSLPLVQPGKLFLFLSVFNQLQIVRADAFSFSSPAYFQKPVPRNAL